jgi:predicted dehydrogenase
MTHVNNETSKRLRVAIIGVGWVTTHRHIPSFRKHPDVEVVGVVDRYPGRAQTEAKALRIRHWSEESSLSKISWLSEVDAVSIGTSPFTHFSLAQESLELGLHVLTEKPFAMTVSEGEQLCALARARRRVLAVVHNFQFSRACRALLCDMEQGRLGELVAIEATQLSNPRRRLPVWYEKLPGGLFYDESPHLLYLLRRLGGGRPRLVNACAQRDAQRSTTPVMLTAQYVGPTELPLRLSLNFVAPISEWHVAVCGTEGLGVIDVFRDIYIRLPNDGLHVTGTVARTSLAAFWQHGIGHIVPGWQHLWGRGLYGNPEVVRRFVQACQEGTSPSDISSADALEVLQMQHELLLATGLTA